MRSYLFTPADQTRKLAKASQSGADGIILDFEDSIAPEKKAQARNEAAAFLQAERIKPKRPRLYVRINPLTTELAQADLDAIMPAQPDAIVLPKCQSAQDVQHLSVKLGVLEARYGLTNGATHIMPLACETAASLFHLSSLIGSSPRLVALAWGAEDLALDLGAQNMRQSEESLTNPLQMARTLTLYAARAAGLAPIDAVYTDLKNVEGLRDSCMRAADDGFEGKLAIHPDQIAIIHEAFTPSQEALARAQAIIHAFAQNPEQGAITFEGSMLDRVHLIRAQKLLARS
ncbi:MAG: CoA ester lyase [Alphaproteobacteria bacterium]|nr:CoA ester lyase [Alphaproteobacteria bacterium]